VKYYAYDLLRDETGPERTLADGNALVHDNETLLAQLRHRYHGAMGMLQEADRRRVLLVS